MMATPLVGSCPSGKMVPVPIVLSPADCILQSVLCCLPQSCVLSLFRNREANREKYQEYYIVYTTTSDIVVK
jgi:hypothetical protein